MNQTCCGVPRLVGMKKGMRSKFLVLGRAVGCTPSLRGSRDPAHVGLGNPMLLPGGFAGQRIGITVGGTQQEKQSEDFPPVEWKKYKKVEAS